MFIRRTAVAAVALLVVLLAQPAAAQRERVEHDSPEAQLRAVLRSFYFNLAHHDWEAIAADVLSAKIVASRPAPASFQSGDQSRTGPLRAPVIEPVACSSSTAAVDQATIRMEGDWAEVSIPRCGLAAGGDEFRLIHFEKRWRFVYIDLFEEPITISTDR